MRSCLILLSSLNDKNIDSALRESNYLSHTVPVRYSQRELASSADFTNPLKALINVKSNISSCLKIIKEKKNISFIVPSCGINGYLFLVLGFLNESLKFPGLDKKLSRFWMRKSRYLKHFNLKGIKTPTVFQALSTQSDLDLSLIAHFPVIAKPDGGSGSCGVFLSQRPEELCKLFQPDFENPDANDRVELKKGEYANYLFDNCHSKYLVEQFIPGSVFCVTGIKAKNGMELSLIYEVVPAKPPFRSENEFFAPFCDEEGKGVLDKIQCLSQQIVKDPILPYGPFVFDCVLNSTDNQLYLLDASPRFNSLPIDFLRICYEDVSYGERAVRALLGEEVDIQKRNQPKNYVVFKRLPFPKGRLLSFSQKKPFSSSVVESKFPLKPGDLIFRERNDFLSAMRGHLAVKAESMKKAKTFWNKEFEKLEFFIEEDKRPVI